jgi:hypothetical protein
LNAIRLLANWCEGHGLYQLTDLQPFQVAAFDKSRRRFMDKTERAIRKNLNFS